MAENINNKWASKAPSILSCPSRRKTSTKSSRCSASTKLPLSTEVLAGYWCSLHKPSSKKCSIYRSLRSRASQRRRLIDKLPSSSQKQPRRVLVLPLTTYREEAWRSTRKRWIDVLALCLNESLKSNQNWSVSVLQRFATDSLSFCLPAFSPDPGLFSFSCKFSRTTFWFSWILAVMFWRRVF